MEIQDITPGKSYSTIEAAFFIGFTDGYVRKLIRDGRIAASKPNGGQYRITGAEITRVMQNMETKGHVPPSGTGGEPASEIHVSQEAADRIFNNEPADSKDISTPDQAVANDWDLSLYEQMQRKYGGD